VAALLPIAEGRAADSEGTPLTGEVDLIGSRVSAMHLAYDCLGCSKTVAVTITDGGKDPSRHRRLIQRPQACPECGEPVAIALEVQVPQGERVTQ
jgi:hypothetical protein